MKLLSYAQDSTKELLYTLPYRHFTNTLASPTAAVMELNTYMGQPYAPAENLM